MARHTIDNDKASELIELTKKTAHLLTNSEYQDIKLILIRVSKGYTEEYFSSKQMLDILESFKEFIK